MIMNPEKATKYDVYERHSMVKGILLRVIAVLVTIPVYCQEQVSLTGIVIDGNSGEVMEGAAISDTASGRGTVSGKDGSFHLTVEGKQPALRVTYMGYRRLDTLLHISGPTRYEFMLFRDTIEYEQVTVTANAGRDNVHSVRMGEFRLSQEDLGKLPALMGETNPMNYLQLTPGVQSTTEGGIGFYVRGGGVDQNLVLYDQATIYNPGHLLGFVSVFNPDLVRNISLIKSGIPARYGGRLSSVVIVEPDRGASDSLRIKGQLGLVSSRISVSRSLFKGRGSFVFAARRASIALLVKRVVLPIIENSNPYFSESDYRFHDFNGGFSMKLGKKDHLHLSGYYGNDLYQMNRGFIKAESDMSWGNAIVAGRWTHLFSERTSLTTSWSHSRYDFGFAGEQSEYAFSINSSIRDYKVSTRLERFGEKHTLNTGVDLTRHRYLPNNIEVAASGFQLAFLEFSPLYAYEGGIYLDDEYVVSDRISLAMGLRYSFFNRWAPTRSISWTSCPWRGTRCSIPGERPSRSIIIPSQGYR